MEPPSKRPCNGHGIGGKFEVIPLRPKGKKLPFGVEIRGVDLASQCPMTSEDFARIEEALHEHQFVVLRNQSDSLDPRALADFVRCFDPQCKTIWRDQATNPWEQYKAEHMGGAGTFQLPGSRTDTLVLGKGEVQDHFGLTAMLGGRRGAYGKTSGSQVLGGGQLQWHIDGAFWGTRDSSGLPCRVVCMRCWESPLGSDSEEEGLFDVPYGDGARLECPKGATVFCSGQHAFDLLTPEEQERSLRTWVRYAANPFRAAAKASSTKDGLRCIGSSQQAGGAAESGEQEDGGRVLRLPLVWTHPKTGRHALMPHTRCMEALEVEIKASKDGASGGNGTTVEVIGLEESRAYLHTLMRRAVEPVFVYAHGWRKGDVALWDNLAVWHSASGGLAETDRRVMHLTAFDGSSPPECRRAAVPSSVRRPETQSQQRRILLALVIGQAPRPDLVAPIRAALTTANQEGRRLDDGSIDLEIREVGALDGLEEKQLAELLKYHPQDSSDHSFTSSSCPLVTRLSDGRKVIVPEDALSPLLQKRLQEVVHEVALDREAQSDSPGCRPPLIVGAVVLCAGGFQTVHTVPQVPFLLRPFDSAAALLSSLRIQQAILFVPTEAQRPFSIARWTGRLPNLRVLLSDKVPDGLAGEAELAAALADKVLSAAPEEKSTLAVVMDFVGHSSTISAALQEKLPSGRFLVVDVGLVAMEQLASALR